MNKIDICFNKVKKDQFTRAQVPELFLNFQKKSYTDIEHKT